MLERLQCDDPGCKCRRPQREGYWLGHCPVPGHGKGQSDRTPSLLYRESYHYAGRLFVYCFAGCHPRDVYAALGVPQDRWWPGTDGKPPEPDPGTPPAGRPPSGSGETLGLPLGTPPAAPRPSAEAPAGAVATVRTPNQPASDARAWLAGYCNVEPTWLDALERYGLLTFDGNYVCFTWPNVPGAYKMRRAGSKDFAWRGDPTPPLWPEPGSPPEGSDGVLYLTEGESDCLVLLALGLPAFAVTKGASARPDQAVWSTLKARGWRRVVILFDADSAGRQGAAKLAGDIREAGLEAVVIDLAGAGIVDPLRGQKDVRDAWRLGRYPTPEAFRGAVLGAVRGATGGTPTSSSIRDLPSEEVGPPGFDLADPPPETLDLRSLPLLGVPEYVMEGWGHLVAGFPKSGKTELIYASAKAWVKLGKRILWLSEEDASVWYARRRRWGPPEQHGLRVVCALGMDPADLLQEAAGGDYDIIIVDTVRTVLRLDDEADNSQVALALAAWEARLRGKTRIYLHHLRKAGGEHGQEIAGATAFLGTVDRAIVLKYDARRENCRRLDVLSRIQTPEPLLYELTDDGFRVLGNPEAVTLRDIRARVLEILSANAGTYFTTAEVWEALGGKDGPSQSLVLRALHDLHGAGKIERDPPEARQGVRYRWRAPGLSPGPDSPAPGGPWAAPSTSSSHRRSLREEEVAPGPGGPDGPDGLDEDPDLADIPEADPPPDDGELDFLIDGGTPEGPPWPADTFEPADNPAPVPCQACRHPIAQGMAVRSRLDPQGRLWHMNCAPVAVEYDPPPWLPRCRACRTPMTLALTRRQAVFACPSCRRRVRLRVDDPRVKAILDRIAQDPDVAPWLEALGGEIAAVGPEGGA